ncbi:MAG: phosphoenolpyruvate--protein phosphotransferase [Ignavibacteriae bacterium]|nr:MAG: phosphoenolpyruvate--protein phosphotransferase [Ignavibacteriota bacterium]
MLNNMTITIKEEIYKGLPASKGISIGKPFVYKSESPAYIPTDGDIDIEKEIIDYEQAIEQSKKELHKIYKLAKEKLDEKSLLIFEAHLQFLDDDVLHTQVRKRISQEKKSAYVVFDAEIKYIEQQLLLSNDDYIRERVADIEDVKHRVLRNMIKKKLFSKIDENSIVIARNLTPADTILFSNRNLLGFATDIGGTNSHVAIIARSLNVPAVVGMNDISIHISQDDYIIIDGYKGLVIKNPSGRTVTKYKNLILKYEEYEKTLSEVEKVPSRTKDGKDIKLTVNLEFNKEIDYILTHAGCGVGLYRTEHMFLESGEFPTEEEQYKQYRLIADRLYPEDAIIRTFDIGGDKILPESQKEANPFLGWRGIRICLDKPDIFRAQLRALLRASNFGNIKIMFPMITTIDEVRKIKVYVDEMKHELREKNIPFNQNIELGIMVEVPSVVFMPDLFAREVDFFSIGTNDLTQYILAADRDSSFVSELYQWLDPAVLRAIDIIIKSAERNKIGLNVCGEMAGDPLSSLLLIGMGVNELSVETTSFLRTKRLITLLKYDEAKKVAAKALTMNSVSEVKELLERSYNKIIKKIY